MYNLYDECSEADVSSANSSLLIYADSDAKLIENDIGMHLFARLRTPPSWSSPIHADFPYLSLPDTLCWYSKLDKWNLSFLGCDPFLLQPSKSLSSIHLFARDEMTEIFRYMGKGIMVIFGPVSHHCLMLRYHIQPKLHRDVWVSLGGYASWLITIGQSDFAISSPEAGTKLIESQWGKVSTYLRITRYEGDILQCATNDQEQTVVSYLADSNTPEKFSGCYDPTEEEWVSFSIWNCEAWETPKSTVITRKAALCIVREYLSTGQITSGLN